MSTTIGRIVRNAWRVGPRNFLKQLNSMNDTKAGTLMGTDRYGNKFFENTEEDEIHLRTRWVQYKDYYGDMSQVEPGWHFWLGHGVNPAPPQTAEHLKSKQVVPPLPNYENLTGTPGAYMCFNTVKPKISKWQPKVSTDRA